MPAIKQEGMWKAGSQENQTRSVPWRSTAKAAFVGSESRFKLSALRLPVFFYSVVIFNRRKSSLVPTGSGTTARRVSVSAVDDTC
jgi:hypothetical protein